MSFIPFIRDYIELLNTLYDSVSTDINIQKIIQETFIYLFQTIKFILLYLVTFQWFRDIISLPIIIPQISNSILKETFFLQTPLENTFTILEIPTYISNKFLIGFLNSFFLALPLSCAHLIYARRLLIQGPVAGMAAGLGNIIGQLFFIGSVIFGFRFLIISWFSLEPLPYIFGIILLLIIIYDMVHERVIKIIDWKNQNAIIKIFLLNFLLIWTEQSCVFQYLGNLTVSPDSSVLETFGTNTFSGFLATHIFYLTGLFLGNIFFNIFFAFLLKNLTEFLQIKLGILRSTWIVRLNISILSLTVAFTFSSIPFYGLDFLLTQPLGFVSEDKAFKKTIFSPNEIRDPYGMLGGYSESPSLNSDVTPFDRGLYLKSPVLQTFEDLNYSGEYAATSRQGNIPLFDQYKFKARQIRELLIKKSDLEPETNKQSPKSNSSNEKVISYENEQIPFDYPTYYPIDKNIFISPSIQKRFENTYKEPFNVPFENALLGTLNTFFSDEKFTVVGSPQLDKKLKQKYYSNPVYKFLLSSDIDNFLKRQPTEYLLSPSQEKDLYKKRLMLGRYNDSLRFYNTLPYTEEFQHFFNGSKSFADRVYNQQFKGTLHVVRRLFSISFDSETKNTHELILRYDQPLFLSQNQKQLDNPMYHEELMNSHSENLQDSSKSPMFELVGQSPLYIGWDEDLRKILITNRLLQRSMTNFSEPSVPISMQETTQSITKNPSSIEFTTWPITINELENSTSNVLFNSRLLFQTKKTLENLNKSNLISLFQYRDKESGVSSYQALPNNMVKLSSGLVDIIPPNRGGFIWPGTSSLKFSLENIFKV